MEAACGALAILIPTRNRPGILRSTLERLGKSRLAGTPLWVYDDASDDAAAVRGALDVWPGAELVRGDSRRGQAHGRNVLLQACGAEVVVMLDDDQYVVSEGPLFDYVASMREEAPALVACQSINVGDRRPALRTSRTCGAACTFMGGACMAAVPALLEAGGYRESFVYGWEEPELAMRLWMAGRQIVFDTRIVVEHNHRMTRDAARDQAEYDRLYARNIVVTYAWNVGFPFGLLIGAAKSLRFVCGANRRRAAALAGWGQGLAAGLRRTAGESRMSFGRYREWKRYQEMCRQELL